MKRIIALLCFLLSFAPAASHAGFMDVLKEAAANAQLPKELAGTWVYTGTLNQILTFDDKNFTLDVYNREGKLWQTFTGPVRNVNNSKKYLAPALSNITQDGKSMDHLLKKNGPHHKIFYYKDLTADSVKFYIPNGYSVEKDLHTHDEDSKLDRNYDEFVRKK